MAPRYLSTTALAKRIGKDSKELFSLLADSGWMQKLDGQWSLTEKGKFEGGKLLTHPKFGEYIGWPESIIEHPVLGLLPAAPLTASALASKWNLPARLINLLLRDAGLIDSFVHGFHVTQFGRAIGGEQHEAETSGIPYVTWPEAILSNSFIAQRIAEIKAQDASITTFDGHNASSQLQRRVDNWLYLTRILHASNVEIFIAGQSISVDIYLPELKLVLLLWPEKFTGDSSQSPAVILQRRLELKEFLQSQHIDTLEIQDLPIEQLDEFLSREILRRGRAVY